MPSPLDVVVTRMPDLTVETITEVELAAGTEIIGKLLAAEQVVSFVIGPGTAAGPVVDIRGYNQFGLWVPPEFDGSLINLWTGRTAALTQALYDITNAPVQVGSGTVVAGRNYDLPGELGPWPYLQLVCGTIQGGAGTTFYLTMRTG